MPDQHWTVIETATGAVLGQAVTDGAHPRFRGFDWDGGTMTAKMTERQGDPASEEFDVGSASWVPCVPVLRARKWAAVKAARDAVMHGGCMTPLGRMDTDPESQMKVTGAVSMAQMMGESFSVDWTMADNSVVAHGASDMIAAGLTVGGFVAACHAVGQALRVAIEACASAEELDAIDLEAVTWPS